MSGSFLNDLITTIIQPDRLAPQDAEDKKRRGHRRHRSSSRVDEGKGSGRRSRSRADDGDGRGEKKRGHRDRSLLRSDDGEKRREHRDRSSHRDRSRRRDEEDSRSGHERQMPPMPSPPLSTDPAAPYPLSSHALPYGEHRFDDDRDGETRHSHRRKQSSHLSKSRVRDDQDAVERRSEGEGREHRHGGADGLLSPYERPPESHSRRKKERPSRHEEASDHMFDDHDFPVERRSQRRKYEPAESAPRQYGDHRFDDHDPPVPPPPAPRTGGIRVNSTCTVEEVVPVSRNMRANERFSQTQWERVRHQQMKKTRCHRTTVLIRDTSLIQVKVRTQSKRSYLQSNMCTNKMFLTEDWDAVDSDGEIPKRRNAHHLSAADDSTDRTRPIRSDHYLMQPPMKNQVVAMNLSGPRAHGDHHYDARGPQSPFTLPRGYAHQELVGKMRTQHTLYDTFVC
jgi:hypothetical protein